MKNDTHIDIRFADIQMLRYDVPAFETLTLNQKLYVYHLSRAALWGRDILWDQNCRYNLKIRHILEAIYTDTTIPRQGKDWEAYQTYLRQVWFANGIHHHYSTDKFTPGFTREWLIRAYPGPQSHLDEEILDVIFNPDTCPKRVCQTGKDLIQASANNYYAPGITQHEAEEYYTRQKATAPDPSQPVMYGLNSRLERDSQGRLTENTYKTGGLYGQYLNHINDALSAARPYAETPQQQHIIDLLTQYYQTGSLHTFDRYTIEWVQETQGTIDFINGFTEVYGDPLGLKASWEGYVNILDTAKTHRTETLSRNAQWFEDHSPVDPRFKKKQCRGVSARVVQAAILGGDLYPSSAIGINLPNSNWIRAVHGSKSVTIGNLTHAYAQAAKESQFLDEFIPDPTTLAMVRKYDEQLDDLHTDLHECLGHGSGQLLPDTDPDALGVHGSTIEEARADLFGLYYIADDKLVQLGLTPDSQAWHSQYYTYMLGGLMTQLVRIQPGRTIEEAHMRNRSLIAHWCLEQASHMPHPPMKLEKQDNRTTLTISDYDTLRTLIGQLLAEIQRIKSEGDTTAAAHLVEQYAIHIDPTLHAEVLQRYTHLNLAPYKGFINPRYTPVHDTTGDITDITITYDETYDQQMLRYSTQYTI